MRRKSENRDGHRAACCLLGAALWLCLASFCFAETPVQAYAARLDEAAKLAASLTDSESEDPSPAKVVEAMTAIKRLLPASEEVTIETNVYRVDNRWLQEAADKVIREVNGDVEQRYSMLIEIETRLSSLARSVQQAMAPPKGGEIDWRSKLGAILAAPEYQPERHQDSKLRGILKRIQEAIAKYLRRLFGNSESRRSVTGGSGGASAARSLIVLAVLISLGVGLARLWPRFRRQQDEEEESEVREVLGEEIPENATAAQLLARARDLAKQGEYRTGIRRAYIALLFEMELRGKLRLHRSKTNRDYLNAMRKETQLFPDFSRLTGAFEQVWYGEQRATEADFDQFLETYQEVTKN